jgi:hypothetical protein
MPGAIWSPGEPTPPGAATVSGNITALNPADGLFLRAEHLRTIETYARSLTMALGVGVGTGVVYGFGLSLVDVATSTPALEVQPGLAVNPVGQPLRAESSLHVPLAVDDLEPIAADVGFWVVEVVPAWWPFGDDKVFGNLCDEPCSGSGSLQPWIAEGVTVRLRADQLGALSGVEATRRRSRLASAYFERERSDSDPWLTPAAGPAAVPALSSRNWAQTNNPPLELCVPIGVVQLVNNTWVLDTWTARRDIGDAPADRSWRSHLSMRPWNVYVAQILQFQDMSAALLSAEPVVEKLEVVDERDKSTEEFIAEAEKNKMLARLGVFKDFVTAYRSAAAPYVLASDEQSFYDRGFDELPPAGFLRAEKPSAERLKSLFGDGIDLRICHARADAIVSVVEEARDLDRIPLRTKRVKKVGVDILIPDVPADLEGTYSDDYGWVAFVRRRVIECEQKTAETDTVVVYVYGADGWNKERVPQEIVDLFQNDPNQELKPIGELHYPAGDWHYPGADVVLHLLDQLDQSTIGGIVPIAIKPERIPLMALRGHLFAAELADQTSALPQETKIADAPGESIVVVT